MKTIKKEQTVKEFLNNGDVFSDGMITLKEDADIYKAVQNDSLEADVIIDLKDGKAYVMPQVKEWRAEQELVRTKNVFIFTEYMGKEVALICTQYLSGQRDMILIQEAGH